MTITVLYSCPLCGLARQPCEVSARRDEDVLVWMEATIRELSRDHAQRSPHCHPEQLLDIYIPMSGVDRIGGATRH